MTDEQKIVKAKSMVSQLYLLSEGQPDFDLDKATDAVYDFIKRFEKP